ncbi:hypothetical protein ONZ43_g3936 [Nemania bipapillata]|uniref:Uncharacterized protein n=1 Tax=Nemania bipapillata TaxID=110536 RepID=A0ACC2IU16_9PEZI|nr:hypothetical protein ONZ43_g3936 [Nemania bipapillata]
MPKLLRPQTYPYASSSTGRYRGLLMGKYPCWDAQGQVRDTFTKEIAGKIKTCLEQCLPESNSFIGFSLFMVGKLPEKTKPTIMIVSDDKPRRKAAFQVIKSRNILSTYPGFELGHCSVAAEFEDLRQLGSDSTLSAFSLESIENYESIEQDEDEPGNEVLSLLSAEVCAFETPSAVRPTRLYFHTSPKSHSHSSASATCGGLFRYRDEVYALTMAHAILPVHRAIINPEPHSDSSSESDDFEITGMDDWDEDDGEDTKTLTSVTSPGSKTPSECSDSEESFLRRHDSQLPSEISVRTRIATGPSVIYEEDCIVDDYEDDDDMPDVCERVGSVVGVHKELDIALIKLTRDVSTAVIPFVPLIEELPGGDLATMSITIKTTHHPEIKGQCSSTPFYTRLPGTSNFLELYSVKVGPSVLPGDSGSWAFNNKGEFAGLVVAGNPRTGLCLLLPFWSALMATYVLLVNRTWPHGFGIPRGVSTSLDEIADGRTAPGPDVARRDAEAARRFLEASTYRFPPIVDALESLVDEDSMTVASSFPSTSVFSHRGTPSTIARSTTTASYDHQPRASFVRPNLHRGEAGLASSFANKGYFRGDFLQDQVARLRRELERAWEIIQEKNNGVNQLLFHGGGGLQVLKTEREIDHKSIEATRALWRAQADASAVLDKENKDLKQGITQAIDALHKVCGDRKQSGDYETLLKIASDLSHISNNRNDDAEPSPRFVKAEAEAGPKETALMDIPPFSDQTQEPTRRLSLNIPGAPRTAPRRRILTPKSRLSRPLLGSRDQGSSFSDVGTSLDIFSVVEEDEDVKVEDKDDTVKENEVQKGMSAEEAEIFTARDHNLQRNNIDALREALADAIKDIDQWRDKYNKKNAELIKTRKNLRETEKLYKAGRDHIQQLEERMGNQDVALQVQNNRIDELESEVSAD